MKLYAIRDWSRLFENNRTRELKKLDWVPIPNKQDGDGYTSVVTLPNGPEIFGAWIAILQIASRCDPRGTLMRDCKKPHDSQSLSRMCRMPVELIQQTLNSLSSGEINWIIANEIEVPAGGCDIPAPECENPAVGCLEGKGREGKEGKGTAGAVAFQEIERPTEQEVLTQAQFVGVLPWKALDWFQEMQGCGWLDYNSRPIVNWKSVFMRMKTKWEADGRPSQPPSAKPQVKKPYVQNI